MQVQFYYHFRFQLLLDAIKHEKVALDKLLDSFNYINHVYQEWFEAELQSQTASPPNVPVSLKTYTPPRV